MSKRANKKDVPIVTQCVAFFEFSLVHGGSSGAAAGARSEAVCRLEFDMCVLERCPKASDNFRQLASGTASVGEKRGARVATYKGTRLLRCTPEAIQCGDVSGSADGKSQDTVFGGALIEDEACGAVPHTFGTLSLANSGRNTNGSQFFIVATEQCASLPHLDARHVSLGALKGGDAARQGLRRLHELAASLVTDRTGKLAAAADAGAGDYIVISDCGIVA